jgi:exopolysaccharide/PEP-CTERM locus tyrosine autokinase
MGKFYEALKRSGSFKERAPSRSPSASVVKMSPQTVKAPIPDPASPELQEEASPLYDAGIDPRIACLLEPESSAAETFKMLRTKILVLARERPLRSIMVTSAEPRDGKSLTAANLAVSIATGINDHVLLVDCDLRRPCLHEMFNVNSRYGIQEYLEGGTSVAPFLVNTPVQKLTLLPGRKASKTPSELLCSLKMRALIDEFRSRYEDRFVIYDAPPGQFIAETTFLARMMDGVIFVVRHGKTPRNRILETVESIGRERIIGVVLNASNEKRRDYGYYYRYYHGKRR